MKNQIDAYYRYGAGNVGYYVFTFSINTKNRNPIDEPDMRSKVYQTDQYAVKKYCPQFSINPPSITNLTQTAGTVALTFVSSGSSNLSSYNCEAQIADHWIFDTAVTTITNINVLSTARLTGVPNNAAATATLAIPAVTGTYVASIRCWNGAVMNYSTAPVTLTYSTSEIGIPIIPIVNLSSVTVSYSTVDALGYDVDASTAADFTGTVISSSSLSQANSLSPQGLFFNTTYYLRAGALVNQTTYYANTVPVSTSTLASQPLNPMPARIYITSMTVNWNTLPVSPSSRTAQGYLLQASTAANFTGTLYSSATAGVSLSTLTLSNLSGETTYYLRVGSLNWNSTPNFAITSSPAWTLPTGPGAPALTAHAVSSATIRWFWTATGGSASEFRLFTATGGSVVSLAGSAAFYLETGLSTAAMYSRYLMASNISGQAVSSTQTVTTPNLGNYISGTFISPWVGDNGQTQLGVPGALQGGATTWVLSEAPLQRPLMSNTTTLISAAIAPAGLQQSTASLTEFLLAVNAARSTATLVLPLTVSVPYQDANNTGFVDGTSPRVFVNTLQLYALNEATGLWSPVPDSSVDTAHKLVTGPINHLSIFTAFGSASSAASNLDSVRVYPIPYRPNSGNPDLGGGGAGIFFDQLPVSAAIKIYTVSGQLVTSFDASSTYGKVQWDARNGLGRDVASGLYIAVITSPGNKAVTKKILIIR